MKATREEESQEELDERMEIEWNQFEQEQDENN